MPKGSTATATFLHTYVVLFPSCSVCYQPFYRLDTGKVCSQGSQQNGWLYLTSPCAVRWLAGEGVRGSCCTAAALEQWWQAASGGSIWRRGAGSCKERQQQGMTVIADCCDSGTANYTRLVYMRL